MTMIPCFATLVGRIAVAVAVTIAPTGGALAFTEPLHTSLKTYAYQGSHGLPGEWTSEIVSGPFPAQADAGTDWWNCGPACGVSPGTGLGWAYAQGDPVLGELRVAAGARNFASSVVSWDVSTPFGVFHVVPPYWGQAESSAYLRSVWRVEAGTSGLANGDPVDVTASFHLDGLLANAPHATFGAAVLLNTQADAVWVSSSEAVEFHTIRDLIGMGRQFGRAVLEGSTDGPVNTDATYTGTFRVGDVLVMETLLELVAGAPNDGNPKEVWSRFDQTMQSALQVQTPGAVLVAVPEPETWLMLGSGLGALALFARRRRT